MPGVLLNFKNLNDFLQSEKMLKKPSGRVTLELVNLFVYYN